MYTPVESQVVQTSQVEVPNMSYTQGPLEVLPPIYLPSQASQIATPAPEVTQVVVPQVEQTVSMVPQVSQIAVSQVAPVVPVVPTVSVIPQVSTVPVAVSQVAPTVPMAPPMPKPLTPSPPYEAFVPPTPVTKKSLVGNPSPQVYQFYQAVPVPPPAPVTTTSFVNVPVTTSVNVPVTTTMTVPVTSSMTVPVSSSMNVANPYSTFTAPAPVAPSSSLLLETPQYQTATAASYM